ncbi:hypothetical protein [Streptomyces sp. NPDC047928]
MRDLLAAIEVEPLGAETVLIGQAELLAGLRGTGPETVRGEAAPDDRT